jgi:hypothetical protein
MARAVSDLLFCQRLRHRHDRTAILLDDGRFINCIDLKYEHAGELSDA